ncbi:MAG: retropepsin-like domain-containing protein [Acidobacteria bacterium]|nr:retropepsin-like domain-containing protein [Acidobacteriota bacterium]
MRCGVIPLLPLCLLTGTTARGFGGHVEMPFDFLHNQIVLRAIVNGKGPYSFILDTGTRATTIALHLAESLHLPLGTRTPESKGIGSRRNIGRQTICDELRIGGLIARNLPVAVLDLSGVSAVMGRRLDGVLGFDFLEKRIIQIDYPLRRIRSYEVSPFSPPVRPAASARRYAFPMRFLNAWILPVIENCYVNGTKVPVTVDTGASLGLILFPEAIRRLGFEQLAKDGIPLRAAGYLGTAQLTKGWVRSVVLGTIDLQAIEVAYARKGYGEAENFEQRGGNLGNAVLQDFILTLDYVNREVVLESAGDE